MEMISVPSIMAIVSILVTLMKLAFKKYNGFINFIPLLSGVLGAIFGIIEFYALPMIMPTNNLFHAILFGLFSGLSATGSEQLIVQLKQFVVTKKQQTTENTKTEVSPTENKIENNENTANTTSIEKDNQNI